MYRIENSRVITESDSITSGHSSNIELMRVHKLTVDI